MTVAELLDRILSAYPGATGEAMATFKPVFYARLRKHEGDALDEAANEVLGVFKPTTRQPFPIPADFENHLPSGRLNLPAENSEKAALDERKTARNRNIQAWLEGQGAKIRSARPDHVYKACFLMAMEHCGRASWRNLSVDQIKLCERRALSTARVQRFGPLPRDGTVWWGQLQELATEWGIALVYDEWASKKRSHPQPKLEDAA